MTILKQLFKKKVWKIWFIGNEIALKIFLNYLFNLFKQIYFILASLY